MEKYLLNKKTGVVCIDGTSAQDIIAECEEKEVKGGFLLTGTTQEGTKINCFLTEKEYFDGKEFNINKQYNLTNDSQAMLNELTTIANEITKKNNILEEQKQKIDSLDHGMNTRQYLDFIKKEFNVYDINKFKKENKELLNYIRMHMLKFGDNMTWIKVAAGMGFTSETREEIIEQLEEDVDARKVVYIINEEKGFNKLLDKENVTDIEKRKEILKGLDMIDISVIMTEENRNYYHTIIDNKTNKIKKEKDFNNWHNSLINNCISHFVGTQKELNDLIEIK